jgi:hypothetical protein
MRLIDADAFKAYMKDALEQTRNAYTDGGEWAQTITEQFCKDIDEQPTIEFDSDTISRHDAIDLIERYCDNGCEIAEDKWCPDCQQSQFAKMIKALPPSPSRPQVIHCKDCRWRNDVGHWLGCPILNIDDDNYCSYAQPYQGN